MAVTVRHVDSESPAFETGFSPGDRILRINGQLVRDAVDFLYLACDTDLLVDCESADGQPWQAEIELDEDEPLGIELEPDPVRVCRNRCVFCFVDQMPKGLRKTLYIKDDDWRTSFLHGSYVTLTNLSEEEIRQIIERGTSPLYVSVHASDDRVRSALLGNDTPEASFDIVRRLAGGGISMHTQAVVCEGWNDGATLERTILDLWALRPRTLSLSVVPVGLTRHRKDLEAIQPVSAEGARRMLDIIHPLQERFLAEGGTRFVFAADELYLLAGRSVPPAGAYEDFAQIENGVGLVADFLAGAGKALRQAPPLSEKQRIRLGVATGMGFFPVLSELAEKIRLRLGADLQVIAVPNRFFGPTVNVAGLLTGRDVADALRGVPWDVCLLPPVMFRDAHGRSLDGMSPEDVTAKAGIPCRPACGDGERFIYDVLALASSRDRGKEAECQSHS